LQVVIDGRWPCCTFPQYFIGDLTGTCCKVARWLWSTAAKLGES
jgi:hypothetical protein